MIASLRQFAVTALIFISAFGIFSESAYANKTDANRMCGNRRFADGQPVPLVSPGVIATPENQGLIADYSKHCLDKIMSRDGSTQVGVGSQGCFCEDKDAKVLGTCSDVSVCTCEAIIINGERQPCNQIPKSALGWNNSSGSSGAVEPRAPVLPLNPSGQPYAPTQPQSPLVGLPPEPGSPNQCPSTISCAMNPGSANWWELPKDLPSFENPQASFDERYKAIEGIGGGTGPVGGENSGDQVPGSGRSPFGEAAEIGAQQGPGESSANDKSLQQSLGQSSTFSEFGKEPGQSPEPKSFWDSATGMAKDAWSSTKDAWNSTTETLGNLWDSVPKSYEDLNNLGRTMPPTDYPLDEGPLNDTGEVRPGETQAIPGSPEEVHQENSRGEVSPLESKEVPAFRPNETPDLKPETTPDIKPRDTILPETSHSVEVKPEVKTPETVSPETVTPKEVPATTAAPKEESSINPSLEQKPVTPTEVVGQKPKLAFDIPAKVDTAANFNQAYGGNAPSLKQRELAWNQLQQYGLISSTESYTGSAPQNTALLKALSEYRKM